MDAQSDLWYTGVERPMVKTLSLVIKQPYADQLLKGTKSVEGRTKHKSGKQLRLDVGDIISIRKSQYTGDTWGKVVVSQRSRFFSSYREMLEKVGFTNCIPSSTSIDEAERAYTSNPTLKKNEHKGVQAIFVRPQDQSERMQQIQQMQQ